MPTSSKLRLPLVLLALGIAVASHADQIVVGFSVSDYTQGRFYTLRAFDPSLGTLTSIKVDLNVSNRGAITYTNLGGDVTGQYLQTSSYGDVYMFHPFQSPGGYQVVGNITGEHDEDSEGPLASGASFTNSLNYSGGPTRAYTYDNDGNEHDSADGLFTGRAMDRFYARAARDYIDLLVRNEADVSMSDLSTSSFSYDYEGLTSGSVTFTYTPQAVPEPASCAALGVGALALLRRRRS